ncbi:MAG: histidinol-phosphate transaminase [Rikenellaceae bacterium]
MDITKYIRPNILSLAPYSTARDEYQGEIGIYLDANENPYDNNYNRYPDPHQKELKKVISEIKKVSTENLFLGNGSDEAIDLVFRIFCEPKIDEALIIKPSYGMYSVCAKINDVKFTEAALSADYELIAEDLLKAVTPETKVIFLCSPNNPSGNLLNRKEVNKVITSFDGIVVIDEAYIDFSEDEGYVPELSKYPNLIVLQTLSKAWGLAGLRVGMAYASAEIIDFMNKVKYPYNINCSTQQIVLNELTAKRADKQSELAEIIKERDAFIAELQNIDYIKKIYKTDANFVLVKTKNADGLYEFLINEKIIVRNRSRVFGCSDTLRITIGTPEENKKLLTILKTRV